MDDSVLQISLKNKERELKLLEERRLMEEADLALAEDLFTPSQNKINIQEKIEISTNTKQVIKPIPKKNKPNKELMEMQKMISEHNKKKKTEDKRKRDIFGEASIDEFEDKYCHIEDNYYK